MMNPHRNTWGEVYSQVHDWSDFQTWRRLQQTLLPALCLNEDKHRRLCFTPRLPPLSFPASSNNCVSAERGQSQIMDRFICLGKASRCLSPIYSLTKRIVIMGAKFHFPIEVTGTPLCSDRNIFTQPNGVWATQGGCEDLNLGMTVHIPLTPDQLWTQFFVNKKRRLYYSHYIILIVECRAELSPASIKTLPHPAATRGFWQEIGH